EAYDLSLQSKTTVQHLKEQSLYIDKLNDQIIHLQEQVNIAREKMEQKRENLTDAHIEVKKFEKMIEQQHERIKENAMKRENETMDDIPIKQHAKRKNRSDICKSKSKNKEKQILSFGLYWQTLFLSQLRIL